MKNYNKGFWMLGAAAFLSLTSCKKEFLDTFSSTAVASADAVASTNNAYAALNGIHRILYTQYDGQPQGGESAVMIIPDLMGEDVIYTLANGRQDFGGHIRYIDHRNVNSANTRFTFRMYYRIIANANVLINGIDGAEGLQTDRNIIKGQALVYRAWAHFQLVQLWGERFAAGGPNTGPGVTLALSPNLVPKPRATVAEFTPRSTKTWMKPYRCWQVITVTLATWPPLNRSLTKTLRTALKHGWH